MKMPWDAYSKKYDSGKLNAFSISSILNLFKIVFVADIAMHWMEDPK